MIAERTRAACKAQGEEPGSRTDLAEAANVAPVMPEVWAGGVAGLHGVAAALNARC